MSANDNISPLENPSGRGRLSEEKLLAYLEGRLAPDDQREVEQWLSEEGMESDALEGLQAMKPAERRQSVGRLDNQLRRRIGHNKRRRKKAKPDVLQLVVAVIVILLLAALAFALTRYAL